MLFKLKNPNLKTESIILLFSQIGSVLLSLLMIKTFTGLMTPSEYGIFGLISSIAGFWSAFIFGPLIQGLVRYYAKSVTNSSENLFFDSIKNGYLLILGVIGIGLLISVVLYFANYSQYSFMTILAVIYASTEFISGTLSNFFHVKRQRLIGAILDLLFLSLKIALGYLFLTFFGKTGLILYLAIVITSTLAVLLKKRIFYKLLNFNNNNLSEIKTQYSKEIINYAKPFFFWGIPSFLVLASDRGSLEFFHSTAELGLYIALFQFSYSPVNLVAGYLNNLLQPIFYLKSGDGSNLKLVIDVKKQISKIALILFGLLIVGFILAYFIGPYIFKLIVSKEYWSVSYLIPYTFSAAGLYQLGQLLSTTSFVDFSPSKLLKPIIITSVIGSAFIIFFTKTYSIKGAIIGLNLYGLMYFIYMVIHTYKDLSKKVN